jgi:hypothetical protein
MEDGVVCGWKAVLWRGFLGNFAAGLENRAKRGDFCQVTVKGNGEGSNFFRKFLSNENPLRIVARLSAATIRGVL